MGRQVDILVIDDEEYIRNSCQQTLSRDGNIVQVAKDGSEGLSMLETESFDLIILDLNMPGLSGMEVLKKIKEDDPEAMVIVNTGYATIESAVEALKSGAYDFISKLFTPDRFRVLVEQALEKRKGPDLVVMDIIMEGKHGYSAVEDLKSNPQLRSMSVIVFRTLTHKGSEHVRNERTKMLT